MSDRKQNAQKVIMMPPELAEYIKEESIKQHRTFSAQATVMLERARETMRSVEAGESQIDLDAIRRV
ncbi:hypothetical protein [Spirochaeta africana]|uniref:Uncharacterized protein n=1 Tax=Spirochaeta africana (strain ATCC 700263 / DSM 8902 / Z-7692) TaxID=889378 RepID=H9UJG3_SPIAZ|nr:hypothetical protein [Spirochaeta africana]AFG37656.1 hypothetical protein Spiaf_1598 [Spirochaeta africana DSM 8902]